MKTGNEGKPKNPEKIHKNLKNLKNIRKLARYEASLFFEFNLQIIQPIVKNEENCTFSQIS